MTIAANAISESVMPAGAAPATAIQRHSLGDQAYQLLWKRITDGQLRPGDKLSDLRLSEELGVSRTPIREALHRLAQDGIVRAERQYGFRVAPLSAEDIREGYEVRTVLESLAVRLAVRHLTDDELATAQAALDAVHRRLEADDTHAGEMLLAVDRDFHRLVASRSGNSRLEVMLAALHLQISVFQVYGIHRDRAALASTVAAHQAILAALRRRDADAAATAMANHIEDARAGLLAVFAAIEDSQPLAP